MLVSLLGRLEPLGSCFLYNTEFQLTGILEALARDPWPVANDKWPLRCPGMAISVAVGLLEVRPLDTGLRMYM